MARMPEIKNANGVPPLAKKSGFEYICKSLQILNQIFSLLRIQALTKTVLIKDFPHHRIFRNMITFGFLMNALKV